MIENALKNALNELKENNKSGVVVYFGEKKELTNLYKNTQKQKALDIINNKKWW